jgi:hypothetical protein
LPDSTSSSRRVSLAQDAGSWPFSWLRATFLQWQQQQHRD